MGNKNIESQIEHIIQDLENKKFIVILLSHQIKDDNFRINLEKEEDKNYVSYNLILKTKRYYKLSKKQMNSIFTLLEQQLKKFTNRTILIIFCEYFFSRLYLAEKEREEIIKELEKVDSNKNQILYLVNFLYELSQPPTAEEIKNLQIYLETIQINVKKFYFNPTNSSNIKLYNSNSKRWFTNETILIYNKKIIFSQKKQNYYKELYIFNDDNFALGYGNKETKLNKYLPEYKIYKFIDDFMDLEICKDIQNLYTYYRENFMKDNIIYLSDEDQKKIIKKRKLFSLQKRNYKTKKLYIIQSNTTDIKDILYSFPNNKLIIQVDPVASGIFKINYNETIKSKILSIYQKKDFFNSKIENKTKQFLGMFRKEDDKLSQKIEYYRTLKESEEIYNSLIHDIINSNFYNIIEKINPDNEIIKEIDDLKVNINIYDLK